LGAREAGAWEREKAGFTAGDGGDIHHKKTLLSLTQEKQ